MQLAWTIALTVIITSSDKTDNPIRTRRQAEANELLIAIPSLLQNVKLSEDYWDRIRNRNQGELEKTDG